MATYDNTYSRVVSWLKVILPLLALVILSTLFLVARVINPAQDIPYADVDIDELTREQRIGQPTFTGVTEGGAAYSLSAARARPDPEVEGRLTGEDISAGIDMPDGTRIEVIARQAVIDNGSQTAGLAGEVQLTSSDGYHLTSEDLNLQLDTMRLWSDGQVTIDGPGLQLSAGRFEMTGDGTDAHPYVLVFNEQVKLLYQPAE